MSQIRKASQEFMGPGRQARLVPQKLAAQVLPPPILKQNQAYAGLQAGVGACSAPSTASDSLMVVLNRVVVVSRQDS